jgi:putative Holliday junction resolvase
MSTFLAFDFGTKRIGIAVGQDTTDTATPLNPIKATDGIPNWDQVAQIVDEWKPDGFVVGLPLNMDGSMSEMAFKARKFANRLQAKYRKQSHTMDERLTSYEAKGIVIAEGGNRNFKDNSVDGIAAQLILESWFSQQKEQKAL